MLHKGLHLEINHSIPFLNFSSPSPVVIPSLILIPSSAASATTTPATIPSTPIPRVPFVPIPREHLVSSPSSIVVPSGIRLLLVVVPIVPVVHLALVILLLLLGLIIHLGNQLLHVGHHLAYHCGVHHVGGVQIELAEEFFPEVARGIQVLLLLLVLVLILVLMVLLLAAALIAVEVDLGGGRRIGTVFAFFVQRQWPLEEFGSLKDRDRVFDGFRVAVRNKGVRPLTLLVVPRDLDQLNRTGLHKQLIEQLLGYLLGQVATPQRSLILLAHNFRFKAKQSSGKNLFRRIRP